MRDREEPHREDPMSVGRGIFFGVLFGAVMWAGILGAIWYWLYG